MKKSSIFGIVAAAVVLVAGITLLCVHYKKVKQVWTNFWDKWAAKRANLQVYM